MGDPGIPVDLSTSLILGEVFAHIPKCAIVNWIDGHARVIAPIPGVFFIPSSTKEPDLSGLWLRQAPPRCLEAGMNFWTRSVVPHCSIARTVLGYAGHEA